jgi:hypothetical protein
MITRATSKAINTYQGAFMSIDASFLQSKNLFTSQELLNFTRNNCHPRIKRTAGVAPMSLSKIMLM